LTQSYIIALLKKGVVLGYKMSTRLATYWIEIQKFSAAGTYPSGWVNPINILASHPEAHSRIIKKLHREGYKTELCVDENGYYLSVWEPTARPKINYYGDGVIQSTRMWLEQLRYTFWLRRHSAFNQMYKTPNSDKLKIIIEDVVGNRYCIQITRPLAIYSD
jgi:hypothetical protein